MRADAQRNYQALVAAVREAFTEHGPEAPLDDIAGRANVGAGAGTYGMTPPALNGY